MGDNGGRRERVEEGIITGLLFIQYPDGLQIETVLQPAAGSAAVPSA